MTDSIDLLISFDTTGSMYPVLSEVRRRVAELGRTLFDRVPVRIAVIAHGDYCDARTTYVTKQLDFTTDPKVFENFVKDVKQTGGGDADECYELVLHEARSLSWRSEARRIMMLIGDANPHGPSYSDNVKRLDWRNEAMMLRDMKVRVHSVHALPSRSSKTFYESVASTTGGLYLQLDQFADAYDIIVTAALREESESVAKAYVQSLGVRSERLKKTMEVIIAGRVHKIVVDDATAERRARPDGLIPVPVGTFQASKVPGDKQVIRDFVVELGLTFKKGNGFYEWVKREEIQDYKEVVVRDDATGDFFSGPAARKLAGLLSHGTTKASPPKGTGYTFWIESTSVNRKLDPHTTFLYKVDRDA